MITCWCRIGGCQVISQDFFTTWQAKEAGWWVNPNPGIDPSDLCPEHNTEENRGKEGE